MPTYNFVLGAQVCTEANMDVSKKDLSEEQRVELEVSIRPNRNIIMIISKSYDLHLLSFFWFSSMFLIMFIETDAKSKPAYYLKKMFATKDYENKAQGGLSFKQGSSVYVLLRNGNGWCTGRY